MLVNNAHGHPTVPIQCYFTAKLALDSDGFPSRCRRTSTCSPNMLDLCRIIWELMLVHSDLRKVNTSWNLGWPHGQSHWCQVIPNSYHLQVLSPNVQCEKLISTSCFEDAHSELWKQLNHVVPASALSQMWARTPSIKFLWIFYYNFLLQVKNPN